MRANINNLRCYPSQIYGVSILARLGAAFPAHGQEALPAIDIGGERAPRAERAKASDDRFRSARPGDALSDPATDNAPTPKRSVTRAGIQILGGPAQASTYKALDLLPSVIEDSADPYGLSFNRSITVRGVSDFCLARTINGLPIQGIVGGADLFDLDDIGRIDLYRGSIPANQGLGFSNAAGVLDLNILPPKEKLSGMISQGVGSNGFHRTFARIDSGRLPTGTSFFISGSISDADKWKGEGDARRKNVAFGLTQALGDQLDVSVYGVHNDQKANGHWGIENQLHWVLDVVFAEDQSRLRKGHGARNMAVVRHFAVNLVRTAPEPERPPPMKPQRKATKPKHTSIKLRRKIAGWRDDYLAVALGASAR